MAGAIHGGKRPVLAAVWQGRQIWRRGRLRAGADDGPGARPIRWIRRYGGGRGGNFDSFFGPFSPPPRRTAERPVDYTRAPSPKKLDAQPSGGSVLVLGDSMADWLAFGLEDALGDTPDLAVVRKNRASSGLIRYDSRNENQDWAQVIREAIAANKPKFIVMMVGLNDRVAIRDRVSLGDHAGGRRREGCGPASRGGEAGGHAAEQTEAKPDASDAEQAPPEHQAAPAPEPHNKSGTTVTTYRVHEFRSDEWAAFYTQADRCHDRRAEERRRAGVLGRAAVDPRTEIDQRHAVSRRPLPRQRARRPASPTSTSGTASSTTTAASSSRAPTSKARSAGCAPATACISPRPARASLRIISSAKSGA